MEWFKNVIFVGSVQDGFIPYESARIQKSSDSVKDSKFKNIKQFLKKFKILEEDIFMLLWLITFFLIYNLKKFEDWK